MSRDFKTAIHEAVRSGNMADLAFYAYQLLEEVESCRALKASAAERKRAKRARMGGDVTPRLRATVLQRDGFRCVLCGRSPDSGIGLEVDHVVSAAEGGQTIPENLQTLCEDCNSAKGGRS